MKSRDARESNAEENVSNKKKTERESNRDSTHAKTRPRTHIYIRNDFLHEVYPLQRYVYGHGYCSFSPHSRLTQLSLSKLLRFLFCFFCAAYRLHFISLSVCVCVCVLTRILSSLQCCVCASRDGCGIKCDHVRLHVYVCVAE